MTNIEIRTLGVTIPIMIYFIVVIIVLQRDINRMKAEEKEIIVEDMQKIVDANEKLVKELKYGKGTNSL